MSGILVFLLYIGFFVGNVLMSSASWFIPSLVLNGSVFVFLTLTALERAKEESQK